MNTHNMQKFIEDLTHEISNLERRYKSELNGVMERASNAALRATVDSHFGFNLAATAQNIAEITAKIEQTKMILNDLKSRVAIEESVAKVLDR